MRWEYKKWISVIKITQLRNIGKFLYRIECEWEKQIKKNIRKELKLRRKRYSKKWQVDRLTKAQLSGVVALATLFHNKLTPHYIAVHHSTLRCVRTCTRTPYWNPQVAWRFMVDKFDVIFRHSCCFIFFYRRAWMNSRLIPIQILLVVVVMKWIITILQC